MRDEHTPYESEEELPLREVGDFGSFEREPDHGDTDADEPELERLDISADDPPQDRMLEYDDDGNVS